MWRNGDKGKWIDGIDGIDLSRTRGCGEMGTRGNGLIS